MAEPRPHTVSIEAIKQGLIDRIEDVVARCCPPAPGSYRKGELYFTLNPGRADRSVGSFVVHMHGPRAGQWHDYAMSGREAHGDLIDLIGISLGLNAADAIREARAWLGLENDTPDMRRAREAGAIRAAERRRAQEADRKRQAEKRRKWAEGLWLSGQEGIRGTPVEAYLRGRGIDLAALGRQPRAIRFHPACGYAEEVEVMDEATGEISVRRVRRDMPAMVSAIVNGAGQIVACHRTYLAEGPQGWTKAPLPDAKKVLGDYRGASVRLSSGIGPRGGKAARLAECPPGTRVYIAEGIETALSALILKPEARVLAAVALANMAAVDLPANVAEVVLIDDADEHEQAQAAFQAAVQAHAAKGRLVRVWRSDVPGEDLNDVLRRRLNERGAA
jgi:hypothetical protein